MNPPGAAGVDGKASDALLKLGRFFTRWEESDDGRVAFRKGGRAGDVFYRDRWSHDKVVRSTHGVNCTGSCSWKIYVRDGIITWEAQQTDYPSVGPDRPEYEPRGCPRGAAFSWYTYSPTRVRYPYARGVLLEMYREAKQRLHDPVLAWADVVTPRKVVAIALAGAAVMSLIIALRLPPEIPAGSAFVLMALFLGLGTGGVFAWVAELAPAERVGAVTGIVGAAGGLGGFFPPLVMGATYNEPAHSYTIGLVLLTITASAALVFTLLGIRRKAPATT
jgi:hypothetical protein